MIHFKKTGVFIYSLVAGLDEQADVGIHESHLHGDVLSVGEHGAPVGSPLLDEAEDVVPSKSQDMMSM